MAKQVDNYYELVTRVNAKNLTTVIDVLKDAAKIVSMREIVETGTPEPPTSRYQNGFRRNGPARTTRLAVRMAKALARQRHPEHYREQQIEHGRRIAARRLANKIEG